jgi:hypothetical protein
VQKYAQKPPSKIYPVSRALCEIAGTDMGPKTQELVSVLEELISLLDGAGEQGWSIWMQQARRWILQENFSGIDKVIQAYGGMGSLNDLVLGGKNVDGRIIWDQDDRLLNERFQIIKSKAWELASEISNDQ